MKKGRREAGKSSIFFITVSLFLAIIIFSMNFVSGDYIPLNQTPGISWSNINMTSSCSSGYQNLLNYPLSICYNQIPHLVLPTLQQWQDLASFGYANVSSWINLGNGIYLTSTQNVTVAGAFNNQYISLYYINFSNSQISYGLTPYKIIYYTRDTEYACGSNSQDPVRWNNPSMKCIYPGSPQLRFITCTNSKICNNQSSWRSCLYPASSYLSLGNPVNCNQYEFCSNGGCKCEENIRLCIDNSSYKICSNQNWIFGSCPTGTQCTGNGQCTCITDKICSNTTSYQTCSNGIVSSPISCNENDVCLNGNCECVENSRSCINHTSYNLCSNNSRLTNACSRDEICVRNGECSSKCNDKGGYICTENKYCLGNKINASDTTKCCSIPCIKINPNVTLCSDCGEGLFNWCDEEECNYISSNINEVCIFVPGTIADLWVNHCYTPTEISGRNTIYVKHCMELNQSHTDYIIADNKSSDLYSGNDQCLNVKADDINIDGNIWWNPIAKEIYNCRDLQNIQNNVTANYVLMYDINCAETRSWNYDFTRARYMGFEPIYNFSGTLDGKGHIVTGLYIDRNSTNNVGLFSTITSTGQIKNIGFNDLSVQGNFYVGGLAGINNGTINNSYVSGAVAGRSYVGGLVGGSRGSGSLIANSYFSGDVGVGNYYFPGEYGGGLVGIEDNGAVIINSYSTGAIYEGDFLGGLVGKINQGSLKNSFSAMTSFFGKNDNQKTGGLFSQCSFGTINNCFYNSVVRVLAGGFLQDVVINGSYLNTVCGSNYLPATQNYFYNKSNSPLNTWDFNNIWSSSGSALPTLKIFNHPISYVPSYSYIGISLNNSENVNIKNLDVSLSIKDSSNVLIEPSNKIRDMHVLNTNHIAFDPFKILGACSFVNSIVDFQNINGKIEFAGTIDYSSGSSSCMLGNIVKIDSLGIGINTINNSQFNNPARLTFFKEEMVNPAAAIIRLNGIIKNPGEGYNISSYNPITLNIDNLNGTWSVSPSFCGDGIRTSPNSNEETEECDFGVANSSCPGCSNSDNGVCNTQCEKTRCGDGIIQSPNGYGTNETCDYYGLAQTFLNNLCEPPTDGGEGGIGCSCKSHSDFNGSTCNCDMCSQRIGNDCFHRPHVVDNYWGGCMCERCYTEDPIRGGCMFDPHNYERPLSFFSIGIIEPDQGTGPSRAKSISCYMNFNNNDGCGDKINDNNAYNIIVHLQEYNIDSSSWNDISEQSTTLTPSTLSDSIVEFTFANALTSSRGLLRCNTEMQYDSETLSLTTNNLKDIDRDNHDSFAQGGDDCDDWPYAGSCTDLFTDPDIVSCSTDSDNDGIKDYVGCAQCKHPGVVEEADDIDNNCQGTCQGNPSRSCTVSGYSGDGAKDNSIIPIHSNPDDPLSPIIGYSGCGNVRNSFNKIDEFCQMVDDNVGADNGDICNGYQRAVKWGERKINLRSELDHNDNNYFYYNVYYTLYSFIPGGDGQNTQCYKKDVTESVACDYSGIPPYPDNFDINNPNKYGCSYATIKEESNVQSCMPNSEASGKTRGTQQTESTIFPDQFIDSFRGELYFNDFLRIPEVNGILQETDPGTGNFKWQWHTSCVLKDKCNDGVSNSMPQDLFTLEPYKYYLIPSIPDSSEEGKIKFVSSSPNINNHLYVSLVDVDDPSCKFNSPENPASTKQGGLPVYSTDAYKINPLYPSQTVYCLDQDRDGFCGCIMKTMYKVCKSGPTAFGECPLFMSTDWVEEGTKSALLSTYHGDGAYVLDTKISCDESLNENYIMSKHFPDCDDNNYVSYIIQTDSPKKGEKILTTPSLGWGNSPELIGKEYSSWNVHPFAPVTPITCTRGYDFNCNKDYIEGYNVDSLKTGETMFDWDLKTGTEKFASTSSDEKKVDNACYLKGALSAGLEEAGNQVNQQISMITSPLGIGVITLSFFCPPCGAVVGMGLSTYMTASAITYPKILGTNEGKVDWAQFILGTTGMLDSGLAITHFHIGVRNLYPPGTEITTKQYFNLVQKIGGIKLIKRKPAQAETPKAGCFLENTSIILSDGSFKDIQDILVGDEVMAYDLINNKPVNATVSATFIRNETKYRVIQYEIIE